MASVSEIDRLRTLRGLNLLDTPASECFDRITRMASRLFDLPIAAVSLTDSDRQWFKSRVGVEQWTIPRDGAPCAAVAGSDDVLVIEDFLADDCYRDSFLARSGVRFYAGAPLTTRDGFCLGAMCVLGTTPRTATKEEITILQDLAAMVMAQVELRHALGRVDAVSGLPNRTQFLDDLTDLARDHAQPSRRVAILVDLIGTPHLDSVMRMAGPTAVDELVKAAACALRTMIGSQRLYHVGTAQFVALVPEGQDERTYVQRLGGLASELRKVGGSGAIGAAVVGMAPFALGETAPLDVLMAAQGAAQDARACGRFVQVHSAKSETAFRRSYALLRDFEAALETGSEFGLVYQPRVDIGSGRCVGAEALMRWRHPALGPIPPSEFIPLIERTALSSAMTAWVLETAIRQVALWREAGLELVVSVNISSTNLNDVDFAGAIKTMLERHGVSPGMLELEITETAVMSDAASAVTQLRDLAGAGIRLAIDDFGTGYSSLSYLQRLPVHVVKIDRSFLADLDSDARRLSLVRMMVSMTKHLGHRVVAEGVETPEVLDLLRSTECDEAQGYLFAPPLAPLEFENWLAGRAEWVRFSLASPRVVGRALPLT